MTIYKMPKLFAVRLKFENKTYTLGNLTKNTTIGIFKLRVGLLIFKNIKNLLVFVGCPPRLLDLSRNTDTLNSLGINNDITLVLDLKEPEDEHIKFAINKKLQLTEIHRRRRFYPDRMVLSDRKNIGLLVRQKIAQNASSLFISIRYAITGRNNEKAAVEMRQMVALKIAAQPEKFNRSVLGMSNINYRQWILKPNSCGGRVECTIFAEYYKTEIDVVHINKGVVYRYGERLKFSRRMFLTRNNSHYDVLCMTYANSSLRRTLFPISEVGVYTQALKIAKQKKLFKRSQKIGFKSETSFHVLSQLSEMKIVSLSNQADTSIECVQRRTTQYDDTNAEELDTDGSIKPKTRDNTNANLQQDAIQYTNFMKDINLPGTCIIKSKISNKNFQNQCCIMEAEAEAEAETEVMQIFVKQRQFQNVVRTKGILKKSA